MSRPVSEGDGIFADGNSAAGSSSATFPRSCFVYDPSFAYGNRIDTLLKEIHEEEETNAPAD